jgi:transposase-like protein
MSAIPKEVIQEIIKGNNFQNPGEVLAFLKDAFKDVLQEMLEAEMDVKLGYSRDDANKKNTDNSRNGYTPKTVRSELGPVHLDIPRDRKGEFEPKIVPKYKRDVSGIEEKVISLYARGMSTRDIHDQIKDLYGVEVSLKWSVRSPSVWFRRQGVAEPSSGSGISIHSWMLFIINPEDNRILNRAAYVVLGVNLEGNKDIIGIWIGENESSKFWLGVLE